MKRKVLLYNPPSEFYAMPLGLLAVGSALDPERFDVRILDERLDRGAADQILEELKSACCVGMTVFSGSPITEALRLSRRIKESRPDLPVVWGGWHPSILPEQCVESGAADLAVIAQGEATFRELLDAIDRPERWAGIAGLCLRTPAGARRTPPRALAHMNSFPPVRYELLDVGRYFQKKRARQIDYSSSRGCPYKCTFCADPMVYASKWTGLSVDRVLDELQSLHRRYEMEEVSFVDDDLFASLKRIRALVDAFIEVQVPFGWKGAARADELCRLPEEFFERLRASGCRRITVGAESGSQKTLDRIKKQYRVDQILMSGERAARYGIGLSYNFITGFPGETDDDFDETVRAIKQLRSLSPLLTATVYFYSPYPGTELVHELEQRGVRLPTCLEDWSGFDIEGAWSPDNRKGLQRKVRNLNFYSRHAFSSRPGSGARRVLRRVSRFRWDHDWYGFPVERMLADLVHRL